MTAFVEDPVATHSGQFPLACPGAVPASREEPSAEGVRPWGLRWLDEGRPAGLIDTSRWVFDPFQQLSVDRDGRPVRINAVSAESVSSRDGDEGPSEDWTHDYVPDEPFEV